MRKYKKIAVLIPCHNEEKGISKVIGDIPFSKLKRQGYSTDVIVVNNNSTDRTASIARELGVLVIEVDKKGKGNALRSGFSFLPKDTRFVVILDGDNTYKAREIPRLIEPLESNFADVIVGSRLGGRMKRHSLHYRHRIANWIYTFLIRQFYRANTTDVLSGFIAIKIKVIEELAPYLYSDGFNIEMELNIKIAKAGYEIFSVPITYDVREGESKIDRIKDGVIILSTFFRYLTWDHKKIKREVSSTIAERSQYV